MPINRYDQGVVDNLRREYGNKIKQYSDEAIAEAWKHFSLSDEYPDVECKHFPTWCETI